MTFQQFQYLNEAAQEELFLDYGVQIADRVEPGYIFQLYQLSGFYIEVKYSITFNNIQSFIAFESMHKLEPYLQSIRLEGLFQ